MTTVAPTVDYLRQREWFDPDKTFASVTVVGCGGIGSFAAFALAKLGVQKMALVDFDTVEEHNIPNQLFRIHGEGALIGPEHGDIGLTKTNALAMNILDFAGIEVEEHNQDLNDGVPLNEVVISALDSMAARKALWEQVKYKAKCKLFLDGRLGGQHIVLYAVNPISPEDIAGYEATLHSDDEGLELPCTARSVIDVGFSVGSLIARSVRLHYARQDLPSVTYVDWQNLDVYKSGWCV